jgi:alkylation response protein AidB-like acyl-CoA dehydrogenase
MEFEFTEEQKMLRQAVRRFAERTIGPKVEQMDKDGEFPWSVFEEMARLDLLGITVPSEYGGTDLGHVVRTIAVEEVGRISAAAAVILQVQHLAMAPIIDSGTEEQKQEYLPSLARGEKVASIAVTEPSGGSDVLGMQTTARLDGDCYVLNGSKCFISNYGIADVLVIIAKTGEGKQGLSAFIVEKEMAGFSWGREEPKFGLRGQQIGEVILQDCQVPRENLIGAEGSGLRSALKAIGEAGRAGMAAAALGIVNACAEAAVKYANEKTLYGRPISKLPAIRILISEIWADQEISRLLCYRASGMKDQGIRCDTEWALAKYYTSEAAVRCAKKAIDIHGAYGILEEYPVQRYFRDAQVCISAGGTSQIMQLIMARKALSAYVA